MPEANGYDVFLSAGQILDPATGDFDKLDTEGLRLLVEKNAEALRAVRGALQKPSRVPVEYSLHAVSNHLSTLTYWKRLTLAFLAEGQRAEDENRRSSAAGAYLDAIRFGHECSRGGLVIDALVGVACRSKGAKALQRLWPELGAQECREAARWLEEIAANGESAEEIVRQERDWSRRTFGWRGRLTAVVMRKTLRQGEQNLTSKLAAQQKAEKDLILELATRAYELEKGHKPPTIGELVPGYLKAIPADPATSMRITLP